MATQPLIFLLIIFAYLCGSIPIGVIVGKALGFDPRMVGSGNIGMTNVARASGKTPAAITFLGDALKGLIPVLVARLVLGPVPPLLFWVAMAAFIGAIASIFLGFRGGRGVATSVGIWLGLAPIPILIALGVFVVVLAVSRVVSLASIGAAVSLPPAAAASHAPRPYILLAILMAGLVLFRHWENIRRLVSGDEPRLGERRRA
jgi:glycerol-3-phosphate acyltransferase PlsY